MSSLVALNTRRVRSGPTYLTDFCRVVTDMWRATPFHGDPHALSGKGELAAAALMTLNQYPGDMRAFNPDPNLGKYRDSALILRLSPSQPGTPDAIQISENRSPEPLNTAYVSNAVDQVLAGKVLWEHMIGGKATRLGIAKEKFLLTPRDLVDAFPDVKIPLQEMPADITIGIRHMLAFVYAIKQLCAKTGQNWKDVLAKQTMFFLANEEILPEVKEIFKQHGYFGLDPDKLFFKATKNYPGVVLEEGKEYGTERFTPTDDPDKVTSHNHGAARLESVEDYAWSDITGKKYTGDQIRAIYRDHVNLQSTNIEDLNYLLKAIDEYTLTIALYGHAILDEASPYNMVVNLMAQKRDPLKPQKGGVGGLDPFFFSDGDQGKLVVIEAFAAYPRFMHYNKARAENETYARIFLLNLGINDYPQPVVLFDQIRNFGLPAWLDFKNGLGRNECPQGDANFNLPTLMVKRATLYRGRIQEVAISNLKVPEDVGPALLAMAAQDRLAGFIEMLAEFRRAG